MKDKEELFLLGRIKELANTSFFNGFQTHTYFLNLHEQAIFTSAIPFLPDISYRLFGGVEFAERKVVCFSISKNFSYDFISCLEVSPQNKKFADTLTHRDFLGALMHLGIERHMLGDIFVSDTSAYIILLDSIKQMILDELTFIKHTKVKIKEAKLSDIPLDKQLKEIIINISSQRIDAIIAAIYHLSRRKVNAYFDTEYVFVNAKVTTNHAYQVKAGDIISVRGLGRFHFCDMLHTTKKGRLVAKVEVFIS